MVIKAVKMHRVIRKPLYVPCFDNISSVLKLKNLAYSDNAKKITGQNKNRICSRLSNRN